MNEITKTPQPAQLIRTMDDAERAARAMSASGFFPDSKQAAQAIVKILAGQELGFGAFASMTGVAVIQGKPAIGANLMAAAVKRTGKYNYRVLEMTAEVCELEFYEAGQPVGKSRFDMKDANAAGLAGKDNWKKFPRNMLFARALSNGVKWYAPDIFNGATVYTPDELGATENEDGTIIDAAPVQDNTAGRITAGRALYAELAQRAEAVGIQPDDLSDGITLEELRAAYAELKTFVEAAEQQAGE
jgi:hypothetical protein